MQHTGICFISSFLCLRSRMANDKKYLSFKNFVIPESRTKNKYFHWKSAPKNDFITASHIFRLSHDRFHLQVKLILLNWLLNWCCGAATDSAARSRPAMPPKLEEDDTESFAQTTQTEISSTTGAF